MCNSTPTKLLIGGCSREKRSLVSISVSLISPENKVLKGRDFDQKSPLVYPSVVSTEGRSLFVQASVRFSSPDQRLLDEIVYQCYMFEEEQV